jgi:hypothetical protein
VPIVAMTMLRASGERDRCLACLAAGMDSYIEKPFQRFPNSGRSSGLHQSRIPATDQTAANVGSDENS